METLVNFRDIGGKKNKHREVVKTGKIFRSGEIVNLSPNDKTEFVSTYKMKNIFDFRGVIEVGEHPDDIFAETNYQHIDILADSAGHSSSIQDMIASDFSASETMLKIYTDFIRTNSSLTGYKLFLEEIAKNDTAPFIFHCSAGKDRTGMGAALILGILEVSKEDIMDDYLLTNEFRKDANNVLLKQLAEKGFTKDKLTEIEQMLYVKEEYLNTAYHTMIEDYQDFDTFLKKGIKINDTTIKNIRDLYLVR